MNTDTNDMLLCEELWTEYEPSLRRICSYKLSSYPAEIDDIIEDTYLALCDAMKNGKIINSPKAWLYGTVNNLIKLKYSEIKRIKKTQVSLDSVENELFYEIDLDDTKLSEEIIDKLKDEVFDELTGAEQTLLTLIYVKRLKMKEIAEILSTSQEAVKQKNYRLKRKIKLIVKEKIKNFN